MLRVYLHNYLYNCKLSQASEQQDCYLHVYDSLIRPTFNDRFPLACLDTCWSWMSTCHNRKHIHVCNDRDNNNGNKLRTYRLFKDFWQVEHHVETIMPRSGIYLGRYESDILVLRLLFGIGYAHTVRVILLRMSYTFLLIVIITQTLDIICGRK